MKPNFFSQIVFTLTLVLSFNFSIAQVSNQNHATIDRLKVLYRSVTSTPTPSIEIQVIVNAEIKLKPAANVKKIYFKILNKETNALLYEVNYLVNSPIIKNDGGVRLFENKNGEIIISNGVATDLKLYKYQIQTQDNQNNLSAIYTSIQ